MRRVAGTTAGVAGSWFGVSGSWSRMRHQRAAAGWSSGRGPAAAADRTSRVASKPARVRLVNLSSSSGRNGSAVALGASAASSSPPLPVSLVACGSESLVELLLEDSGGVAELGWPGGSQVAGVDLGGGAPHLQVGDQLGRHESVRLGRPGWRFSRGVAADLVGELSNKL